MTAHPRFTVIIPTRNRAAYLAHTLVTCMRQNYEPFEVIVADDGSTEDVQGVVEDAARRDPRIRYVRNGYEPGMRGNFEYALAQVRPGFVMALGGDDGLLPHGILGMRELLEETGSELLTWPAPAFSYPGTRGPHGHLTLYRRRGTKVVESAEFLARQARDLNYLADPETPMLYVKGVVSTRLVQRVQSRSAEGRFYACSTPDGYSGIVLAGETPRFAFSGRPFAMHGISADSQGRAYQASGDEAKALSQRFFSTVADVTMHPQLGSAPYSPLIALMTADFLLTAQSLPGWGGRVPPIDYRRLLVRAVSELRHAMYSADRTSREVDILRRIAAHHELTTFLDGLLQGAYREAPRAFFQETGLNTQMLFFNGAEYRMDTIVDATHAAEILYQAYLDCTPSGFFRAVLASLRYGWGKRHRAEPLLQAGSA